MAGRQDAMKTRDASLKRMDDSFAHSFTPKGQTSGVSEGSQKMALLSSRSGMGT
jgi:hypothetical protein